MGAAFIAHGVAAIANHDALMTITSYVYAIASIPLVIAVTIDPDAHFGPSLSAGSRPLSLVAAFVAAVAGTALLAANIAGRYAVATGAFIACGVAWIACGVAVIGGPHETLVRAAGIVLGAAYLG